MTKYTDPQIKNGWVWARGPKDQAIRLFKVEKPETKYGQKTCPNPAYSDYIVKAEQLGLSTGE